MEIRCLFAVFLCVSFYTSFASAGQVTDVDLPFTNLLRELEGAGPTVTFTDETKAELRQFYSLTPAYVTGTNDGAVKTNMTNFVQATPTIQEFDASAFTAMKANLKASGLGADVIEIDYAVHGNYKKVTANSAHKIVFMGVKGLKSTIEHLKKWKVNLDKNTKGKEKYDADTTGAKTRLEAFMAMSDADQKKGFSMSVVDLKAEMDLIESTGITISSASRMSVTFMAIVSFCLAMFFF